MSAINAIYANDQMTLVDDLTQLIADGKHPDLTWRIHEVLCEFHDRNHAAAVQA